MCGIWGVFGYEGSADKCQCAFIKLKHRGPDALRFQYENDLPNAFLGFFKLTIVSGPFGIQPIRLRQHQDVNLLCNGELYNCDKLAKEHNFFYETGSDVECITHLYAKFGIEKCVQQLDGVFAFCLIDLETKAIHVGRDPFGVRPLFRLISDNGFLAISSEAKGLLDLTKSLNGAKWSIEPFPPAHFASYKIGDDSKIKLIKEKSYYVIGSRPKFTSWIPYQNLTEDVFGNIRTLLTASVEKRLMSKRRLGCLLSGGLDSSLISALLVKLSKECKFPYKIQSFSIGLGEDSPDLLAARTVADFIGTEHFEIMCTELDVIDVLDDVIYTLETCDITTIRASICMFLISRFIKKNTDTTVIFSGEGADELAQGYIYFRDAPDAAAAHQESIRLLTEIYMFDGVRADRTTSAHSLELRVPFLDQQFTDYYLNLPAEMRRPKDGKLEKYLIRQAFNDSNLLPSNILWRHKEAFSDGVAHQKRSLFNIIQDWVENKVTDEELQNAALVYSYLTPVTKESYYYRKIFEKFYPEQIKKFMPHYWMPKWTGVTDPSARFIKHYEAN